MEDDHARNHEACSRAFQLPIDPANDIDTANVARRHRDLHRRSSGRVLEQLQRSAKC
jgi:hypothetical protein